MSFANDLAWVKTDTAVIVSNRVTADITDVADKVSSRNLFGQD